MYEWHKTVRIWHSAVNMIADNHVLGMIKILLIAPNNSRYTGASVTMAACINFDLRWDAHRKCVPLFVNARRNQDREHFNNARAVNQFPIRHQAWHVGDARGQRSYRHFRRRLITRFHFSNIRCNYNQIFSAMKQTENDRLKFVKKKQKKTRLSSHHCKR